MINEMFKSGIELGSMIKKIENVDNYNIPLHKIKTEFSTTFIEPFSWEEKPTNIYEGIDITL